MYNFDYLIANQSLGVICGIVLFVVMLLNVKHMFNNCAKGGTGYIVLFFTMVFYSLFYIREDVGDLYTSMANYYNYLNGVDTELLHFEPIYFKIMDLVPYGYVYWRFVVWGSAALIMLLVVKKMGCNIQLATIFMCYYCIPRAFYYQRVSLGFSLLLLGMYFFLEWKEKSKKTNLLLSIVLLLSCTLFHRAMPLYVLILFLSIYLPLNKSNWFLYIIAIPIVGYFFQSLGEAFLSQSEDMYDAGIIYMDSTALHTEKNLFGKINYFLNWGPYAGIMLYSLYDYIRRPKQFSQSQKTLLLFGSILYTSSVAFSGQASDSFFGKMMVQSIFPMTLFLTLYFKERRNSLVCRFFMISIVAVYMIQRLYWGF